MFNMETPPDKVNYLQKIEELQLEIVALKDKNKVMTQKFQTAKKERDEFKAMNLELQEQVAKLQNQMTSMVQC